MLKKQMNKIAILSVAASGLLISGCTHTKSDYGYRGNYDVIKDSKNGVRFVPRGEGSGANVSYREQNTAVVNAPQTATHKDIQIATSTKKINRSIFAQKEASPKVTSSAFHNDLDLPPAKPGECYARVYDPPQYETVSEEVLVQDAGSRVEISPAEYEWVQERVLVQEESKTLKVIPAEFDWVEERVVVTPATQNTVAQEAKYEWVEEKVLIKEAHTKWKKGTGLSEELDNSTGEIMCLVEVPAEYETVRKKVLVQPASIDTVDIPAEYETIRKKIMVQPPRTVEEIVPAEYDTLRVKKLKIPAQENRVPVPAKYETITKERQVSAGKHSWKRVLCDTNLTKEIITKVQEALLMNGLTPGVVDGRLGPATLSSLTQYQQESGIATGGLTYETLEHLGIF